MLPELTELKTGLNKRIDDFNAHLVEQSRRIDALREEVGGRINTLRQELGGRIDSMHNKVLEELQLAARVQAMEREMDDLKKRVNKVIA